MQISRETHKLILDETDKLDEITAGYEVNGFQFVSCVALETTTLREVVFVRTPQTVSRRARRGSVTSDLLLAIGVILMLVGFIGILTIGHAEINTVVGHTFYCPHLNLYVQVVSMTSRTSPATYLCRYETGQGPLLRFAEITVTRDELTETKP